MFTYTPVSVEVSPDGKIKWQEQASSNIEMFVSHDPAIYQNAMPKAVVSILSKLPESLG
ncbi:MAG: hypothetical protein IJ309_01370 [Clostridia bacterium]|nr:hypothetical protein [Clostridia bacterium]